MTLEALYRLLHKLTPEQRKQELSWVQNPNEPDSEYRREVTLMQAHATIVDDGESDLNVHYSDKSLATLEDDDSGYLRIIVPEGEFFLTEDFEA